MRPSFFKWKDINNYNKERKMVNTVQNTLKASLITIICDKDSNGKIDVTKEIKKKLSLAYPTKGINDLKKIFDKLMTALKLDNSETEIDNKTFYQSIEVYLGSEKQNPEILNTLNQLGTIGEDKLHQKLSKMIKIKPGKISELERIDHEYHNYRNRYKL